MVGEGAKGLILINGGGAVALAAFLQAIWDKTRVDPLRSAILTGITWLVIGTAIASTSFFLRYLNIFSKNPTSWW